ncbi:hypothetical protein Rhe02_03110 [Rhizocola hellebori]|uniref:eCIS core domain-containing protein n=1 Tax=Rhizocola hellebori TaxID=1392758 RepID=A0A8J3VC53_9ACTN|nr:DUF4157 domain-containing protein [Rhizocola hellebori]GIH02244.1 hypothetical protein Rhe02_03110 [Rhizocola hellebori]
MFEAQLTAPKTTAAASSRTTFPPSRDIDADSANEQAFSRGTWDFRTLPIQAKLRVGAADDVYEREADRIADRVMGSAGPVGPVSPAVAPQVSRACCGPCEEQGASCGDESPSGVREALGSAGQPLDSAARAFFEPRFGRDLSLVRVHTGEAARRSAAAMNARAYTVGRDIVFDSQGYAPSTNEGRRLLAHELAHVLQQDGHEERVQRSCQPAELGAPKPDCQPSQAGVVGEQFLFKVGCDDLLPGEEAKLDKLKVGYQLEIHGFASIEGDADFNTDLSCHRANAIAKLVAAQRADCPIVGIFKHGASPGSAPGVPKDVQPRDFWRMVIVRQTPTPLESGEAFLDPASAINLSRALLNRAKVNPTQANLDLIAKRRADLKTWVTTIFKTIAADPNRQLDRRNLDDYRRFYGRAETVWADIDALLALKKHPEAAKDTYADWAKGTGTRDQGPDAHAKGVTTGRYHIDLFGEGFFPGAANIGIQDRTTTTGVSGSRVPNFIYRKFSGSDIKANKIPIADHVADVVTAENGPIGFPGIAEEIARIIAPGGTIVLYNPATQEAEHDKVAKAVGGKVSKVKGKISSVETIQTTIVAPGP